MSNAQTLRLQTTIPIRMRTLEKDSRGYPIPFIVLRDKIGQPMFTINNAESVRKCQTQHLCAICGKRIQTNFWFVGGSRCFLHPRGAFIDPPVHYECGLYALQVCPFLAAPSYAKRIDDKLLKPENRPDGMAIVSAEFMLPNQPERFGFGCTNLYVANGTTYVVNQWQYVEFWRNGIPVNAPDTPAPPPDQAISPSFRKG